jgi:3-oxoacyl-[acyl-carrier-protein] synthase II
MFERGPRKVSPFTIPSLIGNMCSGLVAIELRRPRPQFRHRLGLRHRHPRPRRGHAHAIRRGDADVMMAGGSEAAITPFAYASFCSMKAMSTRNDEPQRASRPFDKGRDGFVMGEGAGVLVLESLEHAQARGRPDLLRTRRLRRHLRRPPHHHARPRGQGPLMAMRRRHRERRDAPEQVDYINAHGTSTPYNDKFETLAIKRIFGAHAANGAISSTKSMTAHLLGAAGGIESVICAKTIQTGMIPPPSTSTSPTRTATWTTCPTPRAPARCAPS